MHAFEPLLNHSANNKVKSQMKMPQQSTESILAQLKQQDCVCEQGCDRCAPVQAKSRSGQSYDRQELEADQMANRMRFDDLGTPIDESTHRLTHDAQHYYQCKLGVDLSDVTIKTDHWAATKANRYDARAIAQGTEISFGAGETKKSDWQHVLGHELTHVAQQKKSGVKQVQCLNRGGLEMRAIHQGKKSYERDKILSRYDNVKKDHKLIVRSQKAGPTTSTGHAFYIIETPQGVRHSFGFYPKAALTGDMGVSDGMAALVAAEGIVKSDLDHAYDASLTIAITQLQHFKLFAWGYYGKINPPRYNLVGFNCVDFVLDGMDFADVESLPLTALWIDTPDDLALSIKIKKAPPLGPPPREFNPMSNPIPNKL